MPLFPPFCRNSVGVFVKTPFFEYLPYGVLSAMVFPAVLYSSASLISAIVGTVVAVVLSFFRRGLLTVALSATAAVFLTELIMTLV